MKSSARASIFIAGSSAAALRVCLARERRLLLLLGVVSAAASDRLLSMRTSSGALSLGLVAVIPRRPAPSSLAAPGATAAPTSSPKSSAWSGEL